MLQRKLSVSIIKDKEFTKINQIVEMILHRELDNGKFICLECIVLEVN